MRIIELAGSCVCCSLTGEFEAAAREIIGQVRPECIVVEATGVAEADSPVYEGEDNCPRFSSRPRQTARKTAAASTAKP